MGKLTRDVWKNLRRYLFSGSLLGMIITPQHRPLVGAFWMLITGFCFVAVTALVKTVGDDVPAAQAAFLRYVLGLVFVIPMIRPILTAQLSKTAVAWFGLRGVVHTLAVILWFFAMTRISIAEVTAMNYLSPIYVTLGAAVFLGERLAARRILAVCFGFVGALVILRPGFREIDLGHIAMLGTALGFAAGYLIAKRMSGGLSAAVIVGMLSITVTIGLAPFAIAVWVPVSLENLVLLFGVACFATAGHFTMTLAFAAAPVTVTQPVTFLQLLWATLLGAAMFNEAIDIWVVVGGVIIMCAVCFIAWREAVLKRRVA